MSHIQRPVRVEGATILDAKGVFVAQIANPSVAEQIAESLNNELPPLTIGFRALGEIERALEEASTNLSAATHCASFFDALLEACGESAVKLRACSDTWERGGMEHAGNCAEAGNYAESLSRLMVEVQKEDE